MIRLDNLSETGEKALQNSIKAAADYKHVLEESFIVAATDQKGIITYVNENFCQISKYSRAELIGQDHRMFKSGFQTNPLNKNLYSIITHGVIWRGEFKNKAKDGTYYWMDTTIVPFLDDEKKPFAYVACGADISANKETEISLVKSLKEISDYKHAIDESSIVAITDQKGIIKYVNDNFCKISKFNRAELIGQDHRIINSGYHPKEFIRELWSTITKGKIWRGELKNKAKDGTYYWVDTTIVPFFSEHGKPIRYMAIRADITERKRLAELVITNKGLALQSDEIEKRAAELIIANIKLVYQNNEKEKRAAELVVANNELAFQSEEKEKRSAELVIANQELAFQNEEKEKRATELIIANKELAFQSAEKGKRAMELLIANNELAFQNNEKEKRATELIIANKELAFQNDEKEKRAKELTETAAQLESANQELETFCYSISHDLRAPLRAVNGYAKILKEDYGASFDEEGTRLLDIVQDNAKKMGILIDGLLAFSRLGRKEINKSWIDMAALAENVWTELKKTLHFKAHLKLTSLQPVLADHMLITQVMVNLLSNATKYSSNKMEPIIEIKSKKQGDMIIYSVADNGAGFDMKYVHKLFGVFQRLHSGDEFEGTGVGLAIVHRIITRHGGKVWAVGEVGKGATFYFGLPL